MKPAFRDTYRRITNAFPADIGQRKIASTIARVRREFKILPRTAFKGAGARRFRETRKNHRWFIARFRDRTRRAEHSCTKSRNALRADYRNCC